jgi:hypothetical protein
MTLLDYYKAHQVFIDLGAYIIASNAVASLPSPDKNSGKFYTWFFGFMHAILLQAGRFINKNNGNGNGVITSNGMNPEWKPDFTKGAGK